jgi:hypothetical protein
LLVVSVLSVASPFYNIRVTIAQTMAVEFLPSQIGTEASVPLPYTGSPFQLLWSDILLFFHRIQFLPGILLPLKPWPSGALDELYPSRENIKALALHTFLFVYQAVFLLSLPYFLMVPLALFALYVAVVLLLNGAVCEILNGTERFLYSRVEVDDPRPEHGSEHWIFLNGVAVG